ncbi:MAG TPA: hypothetical protein VNF49_05375 [Candidatus Binataceae bacterium]|nr:hypothetical protein [Candidatus Binataceae bacterium]
MHHPEFALDYPIAVSLIAGALMPMALSALSRGPVRVRSGALRIGAAASASLLLWSALIVAWLAWRPEAKLLAGDAAAGVLFIAAAALATYSAWALVAFGYTISMLVDIARVGKPVTTLGWAAAYGHGRGLRAMFEDRLRVLLAMGLVRAEGGGVSLRGASARMFAKFVRWMMHIAFGKKA